MPINVKDRVQTFNEREAAAKQPKPPNPSQPPIRVPTIYIPLRASAEPEPPNPEQAKREIIEELSASFREPLLKASATTPSPSSTSGRDPSADGTRIEALEQSERLGPIPAASLFEGSRTATDKVNASPSVARSDAVKGAPATSVAIVSRPPISLPVQPLDSTAQSAGNPTTPESTTDRSEGTSGRRKVNDGSPNTTTAKFRPAYPGQAVDPSRAGRMHCVHHKHVTMHQGPHHYTVSINPETAVSIELITNQYDTEIPDMNAQPENQEQSIESPHQSLQTRPELRIESTSASNGSPGATQMPSNQDNLQVTQHEDVPTPELKPDDVATSQVEVADQTLLHETARPSKFPRTNAKGDRVETSLTGKGSLKNYTDHHNHETVVKVQGDERVIKVTMSELSTEVLEASAVPRRTHESVPVSEISVRPCHEETPLIGLMATSVPFDIVTLRIQTSTPSSPQIALPMLNASEQEQNQTLFGIGTSHKPIEAKEIILAQTALPDDPLEKVDTTIEQFPSAHHRMDRPLPPSNSKNSEKLDFEDAVTESIIRHYQDAEDAKPHVSIEVEEDGRFPTVVVEREAQHVDEPDHSTSPNLSIDSNVVEYAMAEGPGTEESPESTHHVTSFIPGSSPEALQNAAECYYRALHDLTTGVKGILMQLMHDVHRLEPEGQVSHQQSDEAARHNQVAIPRLQNAFSVTEAAVRMIESTAREWHVDLSRELPLLHAAGDLLQHARAELYSCTAPIASPLPLRLVAESPTTPTPASQIATQSSNELRLYSASAGSVPTMDEPQLPPIAVDVAFQRRFHSDVKQDETWHVGMFLHPTGHGTHGSSVKGNRQHASSKSDLGYWERAGLENWDVYCE